MNGRYFFWRIEGISDLHAVVYHHMCYSNFKTNQKIPTKYQQPDSKVNRKPGQRKDDGFYDRGSAQ